MSERMKRLENATHVYLAIHKCGNIVGAAVDLGDSGTAKFVADFVKGGDHVEHVTRQAYRERVTGPDGGVTGWCKCFDQPEQAELALASLSADRSTP